MLVRDDFYLSSIGCFRSWRSGSLKATTTAWWICFDQDHARKVLTAFGRAYAVLPDDHLEPEQEQFLQPGRLRQLAEDDKVISVRLALFADMMKSRPWVPDSLQEVGGVGGVGETFLEETFRRQDRSTITSRPRRRRCEVCSRRCCPRPGPTSKGRCSPADQLREAAGYQEKPEQFKELIQILDSEVRLITPTDPEGCRRCSR